VYSCLPSHYKYSATPRENHVVIFLVSCALYLCENKYDCVRIDQCVFIPSDKHAI
jgi:hypothetical protein